MTQPSDSPIIELREVVKRYGGVDALKATTLSLGVGVNVLLGPSGSGKSTLLRLLTGLSLPSAGEVRLWGQGLSARTIGALRRRLGYVIQEGGLFPHLTAGANVTLAARYFGWEARRIEQRLEELCALTHFPPDGMARYPAQLSGGQRQRVGLMRALMLGPELLLLDEPLGALDLKLRKQMQLELKRIQTEVGITFIYVTHDQEEALIMSDRVAVMNEGVVAQVGRPEDLYDRPGSRFVAAFLVESNFLPAVVRGIEHDVVVADCEGAIIRALSLRPPATGEKVTLTTRPERIRFADGGWSPTTPQNRLSVTVTEALFAGERCRYMLQASDGTAMVLKEPSSAAIRRRAVGERAEIAWSVADTILV